MWRCYLLSDACRASACPLEIFGRGKAAGPWDKVFYKRFSIVIRNNKHTQESFLLTFVTGLVTIVSATMRIVWKVMSNVLKDSDMWHG